MKLFHHKEKCANVLIHASHILQLKYAPASTKLLISYQIRGKYIFGSMLGICRIYTGKRDSDIIVIHTAPKLMHGGGDWSYYDCYAQRTRTDFFIINKKSEWKSVRVRWLLRQYKIAPIFSRCCLQQKIDPCVLTSVR